LRNRCESLREQSNLKGVWLGSSLDADVEITPCRLVPQSLGVGRELSQQLYKSLYRRLGIFGLNRFAGEFKVGLKSPLNGSSVQVEDVVSERLDEWREIVWRLNVQVDVQEAGFFLRSLPHRHLTMSAERYASALSDSTQLSIQITTNASSQLSLLRALV